MIKRLFDLIFAIFGLILLLPFFLAISILIKIDSKGSVFFIQDRVGQDAFLFKIIKFRTMTTSEEIKSTISIKGDVRVTKFGEILRRYKIDELPELINIMRGEMSFVGPRPALYNQGDLISLRTQECGEQLLPGITGWAQVNGRDELSIPDKVLLDVEYLNRQSFLFDMKILWMTFLKVTKRDGVSH